MGGTTSLETQGPVETILPLRMKIALLFLVVAATTASYQEALFANNIASPLTPAEERVLVNYGHIDKFKEFITKVIEIVKGIKSYSGEDEQAQQLSLDFLKDLIEGSVLDFVRLIIERVIPAFKQILEFFRGLIGDGSDSVLFSSIEVKTLSWLDDEVIGGVIEQIVAVVRRVLDLLNNIEGVDFSEFIERVTETVRELLDGDLADLREEIREKIGELLGKRR